MNVAGVDVGGTFTDFYVLSDEREITFKLPSTNRDGGAVVLRGLERFLRKEATGRGLEAVLHGTTVATNTLIERNGSKVAVIATKGFRDVLEYGRLRRPPEALYDINWERPPPLVPRHLIFEVNERVDAAGKVVESLTDDEVASLVARIRHEGVESIAISFLFSYQNPDHERVVADRIREQFPEMRVYSSSEILPEIGEFERASTTAVTAYIAPPVVRYCEEIQKIVAPVPFYVMQSNGGLSTVDVVRRRPAALVSSGPAAGVVAAAAVGKAAGAPNAVALDMGGTSCDVALILSGRPTIANEKKLNGYPIVVPMIDVHSIGAGGGSIGWLDAVAGLRVGPHSAGAEPGPVCYGRGGTEPTVTDANIVLGLLNPINFAGGSLTLDERAARRALEEKIARPLGIDAVEAAKGIRRIVNTSMAGAIRVVTVQRGEDPRDYTLIAFGGGGPLHAAELANDLDIGRILVPRHPGVMSAYGLTLADVVHDFSRSVVVGAAGLDTNELLAWFCELDSQATEELAHEGFAGHQRQLERSVDVKYYGQGYHINVPVSPGRIETDITARIREGFDARHRRIYGFARPEEPLVVVNVRLRATGIRKKREDSPIWGGQAVDAVAVCVGARPCFAEKARTEAAVYHREKLPPGARLEGPTIVEQNDTTTYIPSAWTGEVDPSLNLVLTRKET